MKNIRSEPDVFDKIHASRSLGLGTPVPLYILHLTRDIVEAMEIKPDEVFASMQGLLHLRYVRYPGVRVDVTIKDMWTPMSIKIVLPYETIETTIENWESEKTELRITSLLHRAHELSVRHNGILGKIKSFLLCSKAKLIAKFARSTQF